MKILPNLLTVDSDRANFPLHGGIYDFLVQSNEPKGAYVRTNYLRIMKDCFVVVVLICAKHFSLVLPHRFVATSIADRWFESQRPWRLACREATEVESQLLMCLFFSDDSDFPLSAKLEGVSSIFR